MSEDNMSNIINTFKNMLNNNSAVKNVENIADSSSDVHPLDSNNNSNSSNESSSFNISPEMISKMANMLKNSNFSNNSSGVNNNSNSTQGSEKAKNYEFDTNSGSSSNSNTGSSIDFETIMKIKSIMDTLNKKDDPRSNLLYSLKPYLRKTRQDKLDQYVNLFKITQVSDLFNFKKGDKK